MQWFRDMPIKWKLALYSLAVSLFVLLITCFAFVAYDHASFRTVLTEQAHTLASVIGRNATAALTFRDAKVGARILKGADSDPNVLFAALVDREGKVLAVGGREGKEVCSHDRVERVTAPRHEVCERCICVYHPVILDKEPIGHVVLETGLRPLQARLKEHASIALIILLCAVVGAWGIGVRLQGAISWRIIRLRDRAERIASLRDFKLRVEPMGRDELGGLVDAFNEMLGRLAEDDATIRNSEARLRTLASQLVLAEEKERRKIANDLHDSICQLIWVATMKAQMLSTGAIDEDTRTGLAEMEKIMNDALVQARSLTYQLSPPVLYEMGLEAALETLARQMTRDGGLRVEFRDDLSKKPLSEDVRVLLYRAVRELLMNARKYAKVDQAFVEIRRAGGRVVITVIDHGVGFDTSTSLTQPQGSGLGLYSIRERLSDIGGRFKIESQVGRGTRAVIDVAVSEEEAADETHSA